MPDVTLGVTNAVLNALEANTGRPVGDAVAPRGTDERTEDDYPYSVVYEFATPARDMSGPMTDNQADKMLRYNVVCVGLNRDQAERLLERVRDAMSPENLAVPDYRVQQVTSDELGRVERDTTIRPPTYAISDMFVVWTTPGG